MTKKMGRPTTDPKPYKVGARLNEDDFAVLQDYRQRTGKSEPEAVRDGIRELKNKQ